MALNDSPTSLLDTIDSTQDLKQFTGEALEKLAQEVRQEIIKIVSQNGGHLGSNLGVVELTIALHTVFSTPRDILLWDIGHQSYAHKILTGRRNFMKSLRQANGPSGFPNREESPYDSYGSTRAGTALAAAVGFAVARDLKKQDHQVICVIGDNSLGAGMTFEALNNANNLASKLIVVLNDNHNSLTPRRGASSDGMSAYLGRLLSGGFYRSLRQMAKDMLANFPKNLNKKPLKAKVQGEPTVFEELGFFYLGPIDGHNIEHLLTVLTVLRERPEAAPVLLHIVTDKGRGYRPAEADFDKFHNVLPFDLATGIQKANDYNSLSCSQIFTDTLLQAADKDDKIFAITTTTNQSQNLENFAQKLSGRFFDVGWATGYAVSFAAALALEGFKPFVTMDSSVLQRAFDQIFNDIALQKIPVRFAIDRAGLVGQDGPHHAGLYDIVCLSALPHMIVMAPADEEELKNMVRFALPADDYPLAIRYPKEYPHSNFVIPKSSIILGKGRVIREGSRIAILSLGACLEESMKAADLLGQQGLSTTVADARFAKPLDQELICQLAHHHEVLLILEEGAVGGFAAHVFALLVAKGLLGKAAKVCALFVPEMPIPHGDRQHQYALAGLTSTTIVQKVLQTLGQESPMVGAA